MCNFFLVLLSVFYLSSFVTLCAEIQESSLVSRFILTTDPVEACVAGVPLKSTWWSRPYEYAWAEQFVGPEYVVLDAACGISHPFKWFLSQTCKETWACDIDTRIASQSAIQQETLNDLGKEAYGVVQNPYFWERTHLIYGSICELPNYLPKFDRIFCISTLEHMSKDAQKKAFAEFARMLNPGGLVVITMDYPLVPIEEVYEMASIVGLVPTGSVELGQPPKDAICQAPLFVYRCVLKQKKSLDIY